MEENKSRARNNSNVEEFATFKSQIKSNLKNTQPVKNSTGSQITLLIECELNQ